MHFGTRGSLPLIPRVTRRSFGASCAHERAAQPTMLRLLLALPAQPIFLPYIFAGL
jgi:hypothetical protein